jgi:hypothetical protein
MHEVLRGLVARLGPSVFDDPDNFRGALDDVLEEDASLGDQNLVVDAVRLGAYESMVTMLRQGGDPASTVAQAGARLARDRGGDDRVSASWACACLAYAVGAVEEAEVRHYRTARRVPTLPPPPPAPPTQPRPSEPAAVPAPVPAPAPPRGGGWLVPVLVVLVVLAAGTVGVLGASALWGDDDPPAATETSDTPTSSAPTTQSPTTASPTPAPPPTGPTPLTVTVENTCGKSGTGDCFLSERAGPRVDTGGRGTHDEGTSLQVVCQEVGQNVFSSVLDTSSRIWAKTTDGGYVAAIFLAGIDKYAVTTPCP